MKAEKARKLKQYFIDVYNEVRKDFPEIKDGLEPYQIKLSKRNYFCRVISAEFEYNERYDFAEVHISKDLACLDILRDVWAHEMSESIAVRKNPVLKFLNHYRTHNGLIEKMVHYSTDRIATERGYKSTEEIRGIFSELIRVNALRIIWSDIAYDVFLAKE